MKEVKPSEETMSKVLQEELLASIRFSNRSMRTSTHLQPMSSNNSAIKSRKLDLIMPRFSCRIKLGKRMVITE